MSTFVPSRQSKSLSLVLLALCSETMETVILSEAKDLLSRRSGRRLPPG
jgi:hypothetical protein